MQRWSYSHSLTPKQFWSLLQGWPSTWRDCRSAGGRTWKKMVFIHSDWRWGLRDTWGDWPANLNFRALCRKDPCRLHRAWPPRLVESSRSWCTLISLYPLDDSLRIRCDRYYQHRDSPVNWCHSRIWLKNQTIPRIFANCPRTIDRWCCCCRGRSASKSKRPWVTQSKVWRNGGLSVFRHDLIQIFIWSLGRSGDESRNFWSWTLCRWSDCWHNRLVHNMKAICWYILSCQSTARTILCRIWWDAAVSSYLGCFESKRSSFQDRNWHSSWPIHISPFLTNYISHS